AHNSVGSITEDKSGNLWFGTNGGGVSFLRMPEMKKGIKGIKEIKEIRFENLTTKDGLADDVVYDLVEDTEGNMVFGTNLGYSVLIGGASSPVFSGGLAKWEIYNNNTGYPIKDLNTNAMCITKVGLPYGTKEDIGVIWGGCGDDKVIRFDPRAVLKNPDPPTVVIQSIRIQEENICWYNLTSPPGPLKGESARGEGGEPRAGLPAVPPKAGSAQAGKSPLGDLGVKDSTTLSQQEVITYGHTLSTAERDTMRLRFGDIEFDGITRFYPLPENLVLPYQYNHVTFEYNAIETGRHFLVNYQYMLEGQDEKWSPITKKTEVTYGNLYEGEYTFLLKAQSPDGIWSEPVTYTFKVLPPWWRTWWAYGIYGCNGVLVIWLIVWANGRRLVSQKKVLEQKVQERTEELSTANEEITQQRDEIGVQRDELEKQKELVEEKNKDITDSILYAKRIQEAVLPPLEHVSKHLPEHFILFQPRDIVSGDFYWEAQKNGKWVFTAADCTGHGVPGAFMSMLGISFLNEIVNKNGILHPGKILDHLRQNVITSLHQTGKEGEAKDGMDIALCVFDIEGGKEKYNLTKVHFAGANNPLYLIRNKELIEYKADKMPIGTHIEKEIKPFTTHEIPLKKNDFLYFFSDGYADQFGGKEGKRFKSGHFRKLLVSIHKQTMKKQKAILKSTIEEWKSHPDPYSPDGRSFEQMDDILVIGIRV
ncbi:MAG: SpoIIE family protein phosphatase, partial [Cytophagales bacterium]|nr:SpoIIE family protein phosphatase [Cytophagales bacterium]